MEERHKFELERLTEGRVIFNAPLKEHTTLKVGGCADALAAPSTVEALEEMVRYLNGEGLPYFILGKGSNLIIRDGGIRGIVLDLSYALNRVALLWEDGRVGLVEAQAGVSVGKLTQFALKNELSGLEFLCGIPGTIGGALVMNAGTLEGEMRGAVDSISLMDREGKVYEIGSGELKFSYRKLALEPGAVILAGRFKVRKQGRHEILQKMARMMERRRKTQPVDLPNAGCIFKNPEEIPAGKVIDEVGLKGTRVGGAEVSNLHGNFIVNTGGASAQDVLVLMELIREKVYQERGIRLEPEVVVLGEEGEG